MSENLRKRGRQPEAPLDSIHAGQAKRFHSEETDQFLHLLQLDNTLPDDNEEECAPIEELVNGAMRSLEEEIAATCSTSYHPCNSGDNLAAADISSGHGGQTRDSDLGGDLCYLLKASDEELGIPPSPVLDQKHEVYQSPKNGMSESSDLKFLAENWHLEDDFENYQQFAVYEDVWDASQLEDYMYRDFVSRGMLFDGDFSAGWRLETAAGM